MGFLKKIYKNKFSYFCLIFLIIGIGIGIFVQERVKNPASQNSNLNNSSAPFTPSELHRGENKFINPLYECNTGAPYGTTQLLDLNNTINDYINQVTANNSVTRVAVHFRDLNSGPWFGINNQDLFSPSSLLKVPVMMAYFREAEKDPSILTKQITYTTDPVGVATENFPPKHPLGKGKTYTVEQLIEQMIIESDNVALLLLENNIGNDKINQVTLDLGIATTQDLSMNVVDYSTLFRVLYYSTYLNQEYSTKALNILSQVEFTQGLVASLPKNIVVSHKFGERSIDNGVYQMHDCGIVYYPKRPYLVCIMTKGSNFNDLVTTIQQISGKIYAEVSKMN